MRATLRTLVCLAALCWLLAASAAYYCARPLHLLVIERNWNAIGLPWLREMRGGWVGVPWEILTQGALLLWTALAVAIVGGAVGRRFLSLRAPLSSTVWGSGLVLGALAMSIFALGVCGALRHARELFALLLIVLSAASVWICARDKIRFAKDAKRAFAGLTGAEKSALVLLALLESGFLLYALTPSMQSDALRYHLAAPQEWLKAGRLAYLPFNAFSNSPSNVEMLFLFGLGLAGDLLAKGMHFLFLPLSTAAVALIARQALPASEPRPAEDKRRSLRPSILAAIVWGTSPLALSLSGWAFIDLAVAFFALGTIFFLLKWARSRAARHWIAAAVFAGLLVGSKYTGVLTAAFGAFLVTTFSLRQDSFPAALRRGLCFGLLAAAIASPWWIKSAVYTGNPVYPLAHSIFGGGEWTEANAAIYAAKLKEKGEGRDWISFLRLPWATATNPLRFGSSDIGPFYWVFAPLVLGAAAACIRGRKRLAPLMLSAWGTFFLFSWFFTYQDNRFLLPFLAVASVGIAGAVDRFGGLAREGPVRKIAARFALAVFLALAGYNALDNARWLIFTAGQGASRWPAYTFGFLSRDDYLALNLNYYRVAEYCGSAFRRKGKVLLVGEHRQFHWKCPIAGSDWYDLPRILPFLRQAGGNANDSDRILDALLRARFTHIFFNLQEWGWPETLPEQLGDQPVSPFSAWRYNRQFLRRSDVLRIAALLRSDRLRTVLTAQPGRIYLSEILPPTSQNNDKTRAE